MTPQTFSHPDLAAARARAKQALAKKDKLAFSQAMLDHRNLLRELDPQITEEFRACQQRSLEKAFA